MQRVYLSAFGYDKLFRITSDNALEYADKIGNFLEEQLAKADRAGYVLGLSGGLDSAVAAYLCRHADIPLYLIKLPYGTTMDETGSGKRADEVIAGLGLEDHSFTIDIKPICDLGENFQQSAMELFPCDHPHTAANLRLASENRRARQRMVELYNFAQTHRLLVLGTDNFDEHCLGYFTKYGDGASDCEPLQYCLKSEVRELGKDLGIPQSILDCAPSAELSDGQTDEKDLGFSYDDFDTYVTTGWTNNEEILNKIQGRFAATRHKRDFPPAFNG